VCAAAYITPMLFFLLTEGIIRVEIQEDMKMEALGSEAFDAKGVSINIRQF